MVVVEVDARPNWDQFMDGDMRRLWHRMGPLPGSLRLYGGTAMALYRNHRESTDFDFATPDAEIDPQFVAALPWMAEATIAGGPGMVDATIEAENRRITVTFMECGTMVPMPRFALLVAPTGWRWPIQSIWWRQRWKPASTGFHQGLPGRGGSGFGLARMERRGCLGDGIAVAASRWACPRHAAEEHRKRVASGALAGAS